MIILIDNLLKARRVPTLRMPNKNISICPYIHHYLLRLNSGLMVDKQKEVEVVRL